MGEGPIPVTAIICYIKEYLGFKDQSFIEDFVFIIRSLDNELLDWRNDEAEKKRKLEEASRRNKGKNR